MDSSNTNFSVGEIVWGKIKGYPWWPAMITETRDDNREKKYICNFIGDNSHASLIKRDLAKFEELKNYSSTKKKDLLFAIQEAKHLYNIQKNNNNRYNNNNNNNNNSNINSNNNNKKKEKDSESSNNNLSDDDESINSQLIKKKRKRFNNNISLKKNNSKLNNPLIPIYKGKDKENSEAINKIIIYLLYITKNIQNKNFSILEEEKNILFKVLEFLKDYKMNEPINFLKKTNIGKLIKYININVPEGEFKDFSNAVYKNLEEQVVAQLFQKNK